LLESIFFVTGLRFPQNLRTLIVVFIHLPTVYQSFRKSQAVKIRIIFYYTILIKTAFPFLYNPPSGTPPAAAAVSFAKFNDIDTLASIA